MVKKIKPDEMVTQSTKAQALYEATRSGKGTPVELRCAEAILEQARNTDRQTRAYKELSDAVKQATEAVAKAAQSADDGLRTVAEIDERICFVVKTATERRLMQVIPDGSNSIINEAQYRLAKSSDEASEKIKESAASAAMYIEKSIKAAEKREERAREQDFIHQLSIIGKLACCAVILGTCLLVLFAGWRLLPVVTGDVAITYTEASQSQLDTTKAELARTQDELKACKG